MVSPLVCALLRKREVGGMESGVVPPGARGLKAGIFAFLDDSVLR
jgi:hypothetical protein